MANSTSHAYRHRHLFTDHGIFISQHAGVLKLAYVYLFARGSNACDHRQLPQLVV
jgi:hypothetical protein